MDRNVLFASAINLTVLLTIFSIPYFGFLFSALAMTALQLCACIIFSGDNK